MLVDSWVVESEPSMIADLSQFRSSALIASITCRFVEGDGEFVSIEVIISRRHFFTSLGSIVRVTSSDTIKRLMVSRTNTPQLVLSFCCAVSYCSQAH